LFDVGSSKNIKDVYEEINSCEKCHLFENRIRDYHWRGNHLSKLMFIGEALGSMEVKLGLPFVGRSGKKLDSILTDLEIDVVRNAFFTNIVKDRPPNNRNPFYDEILACQSFLLKEIHFIKPKLIVTLGRVPSNWWANGKQYEWFTYYPEKRWFPVWHPSYLCRFPNKIEKWQSEMKRILTELKFIGE
tara:strand:+ start:985 stop:1548 length:564 start_codon:yes stop_codon:yes gene_type:complete